MNIQAITPSFTGNVTYRVSKDYAQNALRPFFENEVLDIIRTQKPPANIHGQNFDVTFDTKFQKKQIQNFINTLDKAGIKFKLLI